MNHFYQSIPGHFTFPDFYAWVAQQAATTWHGVEVGVEHGQSAACLATELYHRCPARATLFLVESSPDLIASARANLARVPGLRFIHKQSVEAAKEFEDRSLDFVFLDADHAYESIKADIEAWRPKLVSGGILAGHDFNDQFPGVIRAVCEAFPRFEIWRGVPFSDGIYYPVWSVRL